MRAIVAWRSPDRVRGPAPARGNFDDLDGMARLSRERLAKTAVWALATLRRAYARAMEIRFCDERGAHGFSWTVDEPADAYVARPCGDGRVWLVDPVHTSRRSRVHGTLGEPVAVLQLLDRHNRDCARGRRGRSAYRTSSFPRCSRTAPFEVVPCGTRSAGCEIALWWQAERTLVVAEAIGTNGFFAPPGHAAGVHLLLRISPPRDALGGFAPEHLLVGHGEGLHGAAAATGVRDALDHARTGLPRVAARIPALAVDAFRRRRTDAER